MMDAATAISITFALKYDARLISFFIFRSSDSNVFGSFVPNRSFHNELYSYNYFMILSRIPHTLF